jgi:hypothetical protein
MTFDIMGIKPHNEFGEYLSYNNVSWHPLWTALCQHTQALTNVDHEKGSMNDGFRIEGSKFFAIIETLDEMIQVSVEHGLRDWRERRTGSRNDSNLF